jgi:hypothetical protein
MHRKVGRDKTIPVRTIPLDSTMVHKLDLTAEEGFVFSRIDGETTIRELCRVSGLPRRRTLEILYLLIRKGIIEGRTPGQEPEEPEGNGLRLELSIGPSIPTRAVAEIVGTLCRLHQGIAGSEPTDPVVKIDGNGHGRENLISVCGENRVLRAIAKAKSFREGSPKENLRCLLEEARAPKLVVANMMSLAEDDAEEISGDLSLLHWHLTNETITEICVRDPR